MSIKYNEAPSPNKYPYSSEQRKKVIKHLMSLLFQIKVVCFTLTNMFSFDEIFIDAN